MSGLHSQPRTSLFVVRKNKAESTACLKAISRKPILTGSPLPAAKPSLSFPARTATSRPRSTSKNSLSPPANYIAVHAYGTLELVEDEARKGELLAGLIQANEPAYAPRWNAMPDGFRRTMLAGIVGFRIPIARIEGKFKISQNRAPPCAGTRECPGRPRCRISGRDSAGRVDGATHRLKQRAIRRLGHLQQADPWCSVQIGVERPPAHTRQAREHLKIGSISCASLSFFLASFSQSPSASPRRLRRPPLPPGATKSPKPCLCSAIATGF